MRPITKPRLEGEQMWMRCLWIFAGRSSAEISPLHRHASRNWVGGRANTDQGDDPAENDRNKPKRDYVQYYSVSSCKASLALATEGGAHQHV